MGNGSSTKATTGKIERKPLRLLALAQSKQKQKQAQAAAILDVLIGSDDREERIQGEDIGTILQSLSSSKHEDIIDWAVRLWKRALNDRLLRHGIPFNMMVSSIMQIESKTWSNIVSNGMQLLVDIIQDEKIVREIDNGDDVFQLQLRLCETWRNDETVAFDSQKALLWLIKSGIVDNHIFKYPQTFNEIIEFSKLATTSEDFQLSFDTVKHIVSLGTMAKEFLAVFLNVFDMKDFSLMAQTDDIKIKQITFGLLAHLIDRKIITHANYIVQDDEIAFSILQQQDKYVKNLWDAGIHRAIESAKRIFKTNLTLAQNCAMMMEAFSFNLYTRKKVFLQCVDAYVALLDIRDSTTQLFVMKSFKHFLQSVVLRGEFVQHSGLKSLILNATIDLRETVAIKHVAKLAFHLSEDAVPFSLMMQLGLVDELAKVCNDDESTVQTVQQAMKLSNEKLFAASCLCRVGSSNAEFEDIVASKLGVDPVILLMSSNERAFQYLGTVMLSSMVNRSKFGAKFAKQLAMSRDNQEMAFLWQCLKRAERAENSSLLNIAVDLVANMLEQRSLRDKILKLLAMEFWSRMAARHEKGIISNTFRAVQQIARHSSDSRMEIVLLNIMQSLLSLPAAKERENFETIVTSLLYFARDRETVFLFQEDEVIQYIREVLLDINDETLIFLEAEILEHLLREKVFSIEFVRKEGIIELLLGWMNIHNSEMIEQCLRTLKEFIDAFPDDNDAELADWGVAKHLMHLWSLNLDISTLRKSVQFWRILLDQDKTIGKEYRMMIVEPSSHMQIDPGSIMNGEEEGSILLDHLLSSLIETIKIRKDVDLCHDVADLVLTVFHIDENVFSTRKDAPSILNQLIGYHNLRDEIMLACVRTAHFCLQCDEFAVSFSRIGGMKTLLKLTGIHISGTIGDERKIMLSKASVDEGIKDEIVNEALSCFILFAKRGSQELGEILDLMGERNFHFWIERMCITKKYRWNAYNLLMHILPATQLDLFPHLLSLYDRVKEDVVMINGEWNTEQENAFQRNLDYMERLTWHLKKTLLAFDVERIVTTSEIITGVINQDLLLQKSLLFLQSLLKIISMEDESSIRHVMWVIGKDFKATFQAIRSWNSTSIFLSILKKLSEHDEFPFTFCERSWIIYLSCSIQERLNVEEKNEDWATLVKTDSTKDILNGISCIRSCMPSPKIIRIVLEDHPSFFKEIIPFLEIHQGDLNAQKEIRSHAASILLHLLHMPRLKDLFIKTVGMEPLLHRLQSHFKVELSGKDDGGCDGGSFVMSISLSVVLKILSYLVIHEKARQEIVEKGYFASITTFLKYGTIDEKTQAIRILSMFFGPSKKDSVKKDMKEQWHDDYFTACQEVLLEEEDMNVNMRGAEQEHEDGDVDGGVFAFGNDHGNTWGEESSNTWEVLRALGVSLKRNPSYDFLFNKRMIAVILRHATNPDASSSLWASTILEMIYNDAFLIDMTREILGIRGISLLLEKYRRRNQKDIVIRIAKESIMRVDFSEKRFLCDSIPAFVGLFESVMDDVRIQSHMAKGLGEMGEEEQYHSSLLRNMILRCVGSVLPHLDAEAIRSYIKCVMEVSRDPKHHSNLVSSQRVLQAISSCVDLKYFLKQTHPFLLNVLFLFCGDDYRNHLHLIRNNHHRIVLPLLEMIENDADLYKWVHVVASLSRFVHEIGISEPASDTTKDDSDVDENPQISISMRKHSSLHSGVFRGRKFMHSLLDIVEMVPSTESVTNMLLMQELMLILTFVLKERENRMIVTSNTNILDFVLRGLHSTNEVLRDSSIEVLGLLAMEKENLLKIIRDPTLMEALHLKVFSEGQKRYKTLKLLAKLCMNETAIESFMMFNTLRILTILLAGEDAIAASLAVDPVRNMFSISPHIFQKRGGVQSLLRVIRKSRLVNALICGYDGLTIMMGIKPTICDEELLMSGVWKDTALLLGEEISHNVHLRRAISSFMVTYSETASKESVHICSPAIQKACSIIALRECDQLDDEKEEHVTDEVPEEFESRIEKVARRPAIMKQWLNLWGRGRDSHDMTTTTIGSESDKSLEIREKRQNGTLLREKVFHITSLKEYFKYQEKCERFRSQPGRDEMACIVEYAGETIEEEMRRLKIEKIISWRKKYEMGQKFGSHLKKRSENIKENKKIRSGLKFDGTQRGIGVHLEAYGGNWISCSLFDMHHVPPRKPIIPSSKVNPSWGRDVSVRGSEDLEGIADDGNSSDGKESSNEELSSKLRVSVRLYSRTIDQIGVEVFPSVDLFSLFSELKEEEIGRSNVMRILSSIVKTGKIMAKDMLDWQEHDEFVRIAAHLIRATSHIETIEACATCMKHFSEHIHPSSIMVEEMCIPALTASLLVAVAMEKDFQRHFTAASDSGVSLPISLIRNACATLGNLFVIPLSRDLITEEDVFVLKHLTQSKDRVVKTHAIAAIASYKMDEKYRKHVFRARSTKHQREMSRNQLEIDDETVGEERK